MRADSRQRERARARSSGRVVSQSGGGASPMEAARPGSGSASLLRVRHGAAQEPGRGAGMIRLAERMEAQRHEASADAALVDRLRAHDAAALEMLMERHSSRVYRVALGITRNHSEAEEVVQDVF